MKIRIPHLYLLAGIFLTASALWHAPIVHGAEPISTEPTPTWNPQAAAKYLDDRELWWQAWPHAQKDQGTVCISCHTQLPYALVRPALSRSLGQTTMPATQNAMMDSVEKRVQHWPEMIPFYSDAKSGPGKTAEAHATESVLNAIILASYDTAQGHLRPITRAAFDNAWALQKPTGDWTWQNFHLGPWEGEESGYQHAALLYKTALDAPDNYVNQSSVTPHLALLRAYLIRNYATQPDINKLYILWATAKDKQLLTPANREALLISLAQTQEADGGWRTTALDERERKDDSPEPTASDGYATGLVVLALQSSGTPHQDPILQRGLAWLRTHQTKSGTWDALSINKFRDADSDPALFMTDAATAYAALALENSK